MNKQSITDVTAHKSRHFFLSWDFIVPLLILIIGTAVFRSGNLDLDIQSRYYSPVSGWLFNSSSFAIFIYHYGNLPALLLSIGGLGMYILSFNKPRLTAYRKIGIYLVIVMVVGPGILVNSILKDNWGRPRPRDLTQFGGDYNYEAPLTFDPSSPGKSFPCGHATVGYYFFALAFVLRQRRRTLSKLVLLASLAWGTVIGWVRIGQGGHFASDVLWAGVLVYLSAYLLYRAMGLHHNVLYSPTSVQRKLKPIQKLLLAILGVLLIFGVMLATPYSTKREYFLSTELRNATQQSINLDLPQATLKMNFGNNSYFNYKANGFGFPGSKLKSDYKYTDNSFALKQLKHGFFTELVCDATLSIDTLKVNAAHITLNKGELSLAIPNSFTDTLFISPHTKLVSTGIVKPSVVVRSKPEGKYWIDAPVLRLQKNPRVKS
ncbi:MAG: phosphatase PAP2 family protein [Candidatus Cloacimonetes bacterium]|nr:phosphatase PAP2 family protein [Candidatus Cloacimonadota bacterium]